MSFRPGDYSNLARFLPLALPGVPPKRLIELTSQRRYWQRPCHSVAIPVIACFVFAEHCCSAVDPGENF